MDLSINGANSARMQSLSSLVSDLISKRSGVNVSSSDIALQRSSLNTIESFSNSKNSIDSSYASYINSLQQSIDSLTNQAGSATSRLAEMTALKSSFNTTSSTLDSFINNIKNSTSNSIYDFTNTNSNAIDVDIFNNNTTSQRIDYNIIQVATATTATSNALKGVSVDLQTKIKDLFAGAYDGTKVTGTRSDINGKTTMSQLGVTTGSFEIGGHTITVNGSDTVDDVIEKLRVQGYEAGFDAENKFYITSSTESLAIRNQNTNFAEIMGLTVSGGSFSINGQEIYINDDTTLDSLLNTINSDDKYGVGATFVDGKIQLIANQTGNVLIEIDKGSSNFTNAIGFTSGGTMRTDNLVIGSGGKKQTLTGSASVTEGMTGFSAGNFKITTTHNGDSKTVEFQVEATDTLADIIAKINDSDLGITASIKNGKLELSQNEVGTGYNIVVEAGSSDFTEKTGFTDKEQSTGILSPGLDADYFTHINGTKDIADPDAANVVTAGSFKINGKTIELTGGSINDAIAQINQFSEEIGVVAELKDGKVVLRNRLTGTAPLYIEGGTSNFGAITGLTTESKNAATSTVGSAGSASTMTGTEDIELNTAVSSSSIKINGTIVNIAEGTIESAIENINAASEFTNVTASLKDGKLVLTEKRNGALPITVEDMSGNFGAITGIIGYTVTAGEEEKYGATRSMVISSREVNNATQISESTININGTDINVSGTIRDVINTINAHSADTGVEAYINTENHLTFRAIEYGAVDVTVQIKSGDLSRVIGMGSYTTTAGSNSQVEKIYASVTGGVTGLDNYSQILTGSSLVLSTVDAQTGAVTKTDIGVSSITTIGDLISKINSMTSKTNIEAKLTTDGSLQLTATTDAVRSIGIEIGGTGDLGRVTGLGNYTITGTTGDGDVSKQTFSNITGTNNVTANTQITDTQFTLSYVNDAGVNVTSQVFSFKTGQTLQDVMDAVNNSNWYVRADIKDGKFVFTSRAVGPFDLSINILKNDDGTTGDFGRVVGMATMSTLKNDPSQQRKDPATITGGTTGLKLTDEIMGSNSITIWMTRQNSYTGKDTQTGSGDLLSKAATITFKDADGNGHVTIQEAINQINAQASTTKVKASLINGQFVLTQIDNLNADDAAKYDTNGGANTAGEGDTIKYTLAGTGDFAYITGFGSYSTSGQSNTGSMSGQYKSVLTGATTVSANGSEQILGGSITLTGLTADNTVISKTINLSTGTLQNALNTINSAGLGITAKIENNKVTFTSNYFTSLGISVSGDTDFLRVSGLGNYTIGNASSSSASGTDEGSHYHGVSTSYVLTGGNIKSGSLSIQGVNFDVLGKTAADIVSAINASGVAIAQLQDDKLVIQAVASSSSNSTNLSISASGDAARVLGLANYANNGATLQESTQWYYWYHYTGEQWNKQYDDWDLTQDYKGQDSYYVSTHTQTGQKYTYRVQDEIWETRYTDWSSSKSETYKSEANWKLEERGTTYTDYTEWTEGAVKYTNWGSSKTPTHGGTMETTTVTTSKNLTDDINTLMELTNSDVSNWSSVYLRGSTASVSDDGKRLIIDVNEQIFKDQNGGHWGGFTADILYGQALSTSYLGTLGEALVYYMTTNISDIIIASGGERPSFMSVQPGTMAGYVAEQHNRQNAGGGTGIYGYIKSIDTTTGTVELDLELFARDLREYLNANYADELTVYTTTTQYREKYYTAPTPTHGGVNESITLITKANFKTISFYDFTSDRHFASVSGNTIKSGKVDYDEKWEFFGDVTQTIYAFVTGGKDYATHPGFYNNLNKAAMSDSSLITYNSDETVSINFTKLFDKMWELGMNDYVSQKKLYREKYTVNTKEYREVYDVKTQDAKYEERSTGFSDTRTTNLTAAGVESDDSRISNVKTISRVWYYETYFKKVADLSWDSNYSEDFFNDPGHGKVNNSETQYRNMTSTQMEGDTPPSTAPRMMRAAAFSASSIPSSAGYIFAGKTSANSLNNYSTNTAFAGQVAGTLKFISTKTGDYIKDKNGNVLTLTYSANESLDSIFSRLVQLQGQTVAGKLYNLFYSIDSTQARTHAAFKGIKIEDSGNAMKLAGYATSGYSQNSNKTDSTNADYNGIKKGSASLTGSVSGLSGSTIRPFQSSSSGKATESGNDTFDVYVGSLKVGTVTYNANSTIQSVLNQIEAMQYDYATGKYVSTPFTDGKSNNDDNSFYEYSEGSQVGYVDGSGQIHYTAKLQAKLDSSGRIVITSDIYNPSAQAISIKNDTGSFAKLTGLNSASITNSGTLKKGDEGTYTYTGASIAGMKGDTNLTFVGPGKFTVTIDDGSRSDTNSTVNLKQIQFDVQVLESDSVQDVLDKIVSQAKSQIASKYGVSTSSIAMSASVQNNKIVITMDGKYGENITFTNDTSNFVQRTGLSTVSKTYNENNKQVVESSGYDRITGSVDTITKDLIMGNLTSESFTISGGNGTYTINIQNGWSIQKIIDEIYSQTNGHYKAGIFNADIFNQNQQQNASNYDSAAKGSFYIESTVQTSVDTSVSDSDFTRRVGLVSSNLTTGPSEETFKGDHGYFNYYSNSIQGLKPNSIISGLKDGKLTFTLHATQATGQTGSITYRPDITYTIDIAYNDTVTSILNKMKQAILIAEDEKQEHDDVIDDNRIDRLDFHVDYDPNTDSGKISLQIIGNYASGITFDSDTSGFIQALGLDTKNHTYNSNYTSQEVSSGKSMITGSVQNLTESKIFGNMTEGTLTLKAGSASKTINIKSTDRIKDIIDKINEGGIFTAGLDDKGRLFIKTNDQNSNAIQVSGTSDFAKLAGLISGSWNYSATTSKGSENYSKFTGSVYGLSANQTFNNMTSGTFYVKAAGLNTVSVNVVQGVTKISDVINQINASADFSAELDEAGRLVISTKKASGSAVTIDAGSTNYTTVVGLTSGTLGGNASFVSGKQDVFSSLKGSASGLDFSSRVSAGDFKISVTDASGNTTSQTFTLSGNESISDVAAMISNSSLGLSAVIDASDNSLVIKSKTAGAFSISLQDGTSNFAELTGFTKQGSQASASVSGSLSTLTSTKTVGNVEALGFSVGDFSIALTDTNGNITQKRTINISKNDTIDTIISKINSLDLGISAIVNSNGNLVLVRNETTSAGGIAVLKGTSDFTNKIGFTSGGTLSSNASFEAGQDATKTVLTSNSLSASAASDTLASLGITDGNFIINGQNISVKAAESIASLLSKINASFGLGDQNGVYAEFTGGKIVLTSNSASSNATINIEAGTSNISEILGFTNAQKLNESAQTKGDNAIYTINGKAYESTSNIISLTDSADITQTGSADETIRFTIKNTGSGTIDIGVKSLNDAANMLNRFVNSFNSSMTMASSAELASDPAFASIIQTIKNNLFNSVGSYKQVSKELAAMGINVYSTTSTASDGERLSIAFNKSKFIEAYLADPQKVLDILVGNDSKPIDTSEAGAFTKLSDTLHNSVNPYFNSNINNIQTQIDNINQQITQNNSELTNITNTLALGSTSTSFDDMSEYLKQLEAQYKVVNDLIDNMRNNYNQSITRLVLNRF